jgi:NAD(P)-dependent dehydrogenase (short-subunit alcohol dehydrogenase family)
MYELRPFGIKVRLIEPGTIKTDFYGRSMDAAKKPELSDYDAWGDRALAAMGRAASGAPGPEIVARRIWRAVNRRGGKLRYLVGREGALVLLKRWIPNSWFFALIRAALGA